MLFVEVVWEPLCSMLGWLSLVTPMNFGSQFCRHGRGLWDLPDNTISGTSGINPVAIISVATLTSFL